MIDLYTFTTSNGQRVSVMLEATGLPYRTHKIDLSKGEQKKPEFLKINPAGQIPAIVDHGGPGGAPITLTQSAAIMVYLAERSGRFLPTEATARLRTLEAFMNVMTDMAPASSAIFYMSQATNPSNDQVMAFCRNRFLGMMAQADRRLGENEFLAGKDLSIADLALYPTAAGRKAIIEEAPGLANLKAWMSAMAARPDVAKGMAVPA